MVLFTALRRRFSLCFGMAINWDRDDIRDFASEFVDTADAKIDMAIAMAGGRLSEDEWKSLYQQAGIFLTCHLLKLMGQGTGTSANGPLSSGPVSSITVGSVSTTFAVSAVGNNNNASFASGLGRTSYGMLYLELLNAAGFAGFTA